MFNHVLECLNMISLTARYISIVIKTKDNLKKFCKFIYFGLTKEKEKIKRSHLSILNIFIGIARSSNGFVY